LGVVPPFSIRIAIRRMESAGSVAGGYSALSTAGSILGTVLTAFILIPSFPVRTLLLALSGTLALCALLLMRDRASVLTAGAASLACGLGGFAMGPPPVIGGEKVLMRRDTPYHHILVTQLDATRYLRFDNLTQSAVNLKYPDRSVYGYDQAFFLSFALRPAIRRICVIGLGGGVLSRAFARPEVARDYFLYEESSGVRTFIEDGRVFLARSGPAYDLIVLDAFNATGVPFHLTTREFLGTVRSRLTPDGVFAANYIGKLMGKDGRLFWASYQTIRKHFGQVYTANAELSAGKSAPWSNVILIATVSADPIALERIQARANELVKRWNLPKLSYYSDALLHSPEPPPGTLELTDALAPVEALQNF
jgi:spermidine synthase